MSIIKIKKRYNVDGYIVYAEENEIKTCNHCGKPFLYGMLNNWGDAVHEDCFEAYMNNLYGEDKWKPTKDGEEDMAGGYYLGLNNEGHWESTGFFYTEWFDDYDVVFSYNQSRKNKINFLAHRDSKQNIDYIKVYIGINANGDEMYTTFENPTEDEIKWEVNE